MDLGFEWVSGSGPKHRDFGGNDAFTQSLMDHYRVQRVREIAADNINIGNYNLGKKVAQYTDPKTGAIRNNGLDHSLNSSTMNSGTHIAPELGGYSEWWTQHIAKPLNTYYDSGRFSKKTQDITWTETVDLDSPKAPSASSGSLAGQPLLTAD